MPEGSAVHLNASQGAAEGGKADRFSHRPLSLGAPSNLGGELCWSSRVRKQVQRAQKGGRGRAGCSHGIAGPSASGGKRRRRCRGARRVPAGPKAWQRVSFAPLSRPAHPSTPFTAYEEAAVGVRRGRRREDSHCRRRGIRSEVARLL